MTFAYSDLVASLALMISLWALTQGARHRRGDLFLTETQVRAEIQNRLVRLMEMPSRLMADWRAVLAARSILDSSVKTQKEEAIGQLKSELNSLYAELGSIPQSSGMRALFRGEQTLAELHTLRAKVEVVALKLHDEEQALTDNRIALTRARGI